MQLCKKCSNLMVPKKEENKPVLMCRRCGNKKRMVGKEGFKISEKKEHDPLESIPVIEEDSETLPKTKIDCPECENKEAIWWTLQTRSSDEAETRFYRCTKCKKTWREYS